MTRFRSTLVLTDGLKSSGLDRTYWREPPLKLRLGKRTNLRTMVAAVAIFSSMSDGVFAQTTPTNPSAASTTSTTPSYSTSPNTPCYSSTNPTSPCYSANAPGNPCYSATRPNQPCSTTTTPDSRILSTPSPAAAVTSQGTSHALTADQAKVQIEAKGYSNVSGLRKDGKGFWRGKAQKDGIPADVTLDLSGNVTPN
jgi:hypothetical protein